MGGMLGRIVFSESGLPVSEYRCRREELFVEDEWEWSADRHRAFRWPSHGDAEKAVEAHGWMDALGTHRPFAIVTGDEARAERRGALPPPRTRRDDATEDALLRHLRAGLDSHEVYERTAKRMGERDE